METLSNTNMDLQLSHLAEIESFSSRFARMGDSYILARIDNKHPGGSLHPTSISLGQSVRTNGALMIINHQGKSTLEINHTDFELNDNDVVFLSPGTLVNLKDISSTYDIELLFASTWFMSSINIDFNALDIKALISIRRPVVSLSVRQAALVVKYLELLAANSADNEDDDTAPATPTANIQAKSAGLRVQTAKALISALIYQLFRFTFDNLGMDNAPVKTDKPMRQRTYAHDFMKLVHLHYVRERSVSFYAHKLCVSAKYLSMIIKDATGRTATEWINYFVCIEAKNMLKYSGKSIQQVSYALNFPTQSAFGKFFKRVTGQSPSEFMRS